VGDFPSLRAASAAFSWGLAFAPKLNGMSPTINAAKVAAMRTLIVIAVALLGIALANKAARSPFAGQSFTA
jgi:hypothetical protein